MILIVESECKDFGVSLNEHYESGRGSKPIWIINSIMHV